MFTEIQFYTEDVQEANGGSEGNKGVREDGEAEGIMGLAGKLEKLQDGEAMESDGGRGGESDDGRGEEVDTRQEVTGEVEREHDERREKLRGGHSMESTTSSLVDGLNIDYSIDDIRPITDRPLGSRDPTPPILLAPEDDDRLTGNMATGFTAAGIEQTEEGSRDPGLESPDMGRGSDSVPISPLHSGVLHDGFVFAIHRKTVS